MVLVPFLFAVALCEAANFVGIGVLPKGAFAAVTEFAVFSKFAGVGVERVSVQGEVSGRGVYGPCRSENSGACGGRDVMQREARRVPWWWRATTAGGAIRDGTTAVGRGIIFLC
jgi:hypothetical protein